MYFVVVVLRQKTLKKQQQQRKKIKKIKNYWIGYALYVWHAQAPCWGYAHLFSFDLVSRCCTRALLLIMIIILLVLRPYCLQAMLVLGCFARGLSSMCLLIFHGHWTLLYHFLWFFHPCMVFHSVATGTGSFMVGETAGLIGRRRRGDCRPAIFQKG